MRSERRASRLFSLILAKLVIRYPTKGLYTHIISVQFMQFHNGKKCFYDKDNGDNETRKIEPPYITVQH